MSTYLTLPSVNALNWLREYSHGVVWERPDGLRARCFGPRGEGGFTCVQCDYEIMIVGLLTELGKISQDELTELSGITTYARIDQQESKHKAP